MEWIPLLVGGLSQNVILNLNLSDWTHPSSPVEGTTPIRVLYYRRNMSSCQMHLFHGWNSGTPLHSKMRLWLECSYILSFGEYWSVQYVSKHCSFTCFSIKLTMSANVALQLFLSYNSQAIVHLSLRLYGSFFMTEIMLAGIFNSSMY